MLKSERGSITVFTLTVMLFFIVILMGIFVSTNNARKAQKSADTSIIDSYQKDVNLVNEIYNEKILQIDKTKKTQPVKINWDSENIIHNTEEDNAIATASIDILDNQVDLNSTKCMVNTSSEEIGTDSELWATEQAINVTSTSGKIQTTVTYDTSFYVHVLVIRKDNSKEETISKGLNVNKTQGAQETEKVPYYFEEVSHWGGNGYPATYQIKIIIKNDIQDFKNWIVSFQVPEGLNSNEVTCYGASKVEVNGNIVTVYSQSWNGDLNKGDYLQIECQMTFNDSVDFNVTNVELTGEPKNEYNYDNIVEKEENGIKYKYEVSNHWGDDQSYTYQFRIYINVDKDISDWNTCFKIPNGIKSENAYCWDASKVEIDGQSVKLYSNDWNKMLKKGDVLELNCQFTFDKSVDFKIEDLNFNTI